MDANALFGLYYFGGYVIVSIFLGIMLDLTIKEKIKHAEVRDALEQKKIQEEMVDGANNPSSAFTTSACKT